MILAHVWFCLLFLVHLQQGLCESEQHQKKKKNEHQQENFPETETQKHF